VTGSEPGVVAVTLEDQLAAALAADASVHSLLESPAVAPLPAQLAIVRPRSSRPAPMGC
jgi:hypothetical protein